LGVQQPFAVAGASGGIGVEPDAEPRRIRDGEVAAAAAIDRRFATEGTLVRDAWLGVPQFGAGKAGST
jgi:hypothetical protein